MCYNDNVLIIYFNKYHYFINKAEDGGLTTVYYHLVFTSLDLSIMSNQISYKIFANITGFQIFDPSNLKLESYYYEMNSKRKEKGKPIFSFKPVI